MPAPSPPHGGKKRARFLVMTGDLAERESSKSRFAAV